MQQIVNEYARNWTGSYASYNEAIKHPMTGSPGPTQVAIAITRYGITPPDSDWGPALLTVADDDVLYVKFARDHNVVSTTYTNYIPKSVVLHTYKAGETLPIVWANPGVRADLQISHHIKRQVLVISFMSKDLSYYIAFPSEELTQEWHDFTPIARFNYGLIARLEIPEDALSNGQILKREYGRALEDTHWRPVLVGFIAKDPTVTGPVMANRVQSSRSGFVQFDVHGLLREVQKFIRVHHPGILRLYGYTFFTKGEFAPIKTEGRGTTQADDPWLIQERVYGPAGGPPVSLQDYIKKLGPPPIDLQVKIAKSMAVALEYLHRYSVHRDLNPDNVLLVYGADGRPTGAVKLYNYNKVAFSTQSFMDSRGPVADTRFASPELNFNSELERKLNIEPGSDLEKKIDVFTYGMVLWAMATGQLEPWSQDLRTDMIRLKQRPPNGSERWNPEARPPLVGNAAETSPLRNIIDVAWTHDIRKRPSAKEIVAMFP